MNLSTNEIRQPKSTASTEQPPRTTVQQPAPKMRRELLAVVVALVALALGFGVWTLSRKLSPDVSGTGARESAYVASFPEKTIAVLPFEDRSKPKRDLYLADGVQDDVLTALSKVADIKVISRTSVMSYAAGRPRNLREIAQNLGAAYILEGSVQQNGNKVKIYVQLTDGRRDERVWTETYERDLSDVFGMRSEIVQRVASELDASISPQEVEAVEERPTHDVVAYGLYARAKTLINSVSLTAQINEKLAQAIQLLDQAIARDPNFYLAYCQLAAAHGYVYFFGLDHTQTRLGLAEAAVQTVGRLRPDAGEMHLAKANFYYRCFLDYEKARAELALAQRTLRNNPEIFELTGYIDRRQGLWSESSRTLQRALTLDPRNVFILQQIALSYQEMRQFGAMAAALDRAHTLSPSDSDTRVTRALVEIEWRANTRPLHDTIQGLLAQNPAGASDYADQWLYLSLCERDPAAAARAVAAIPPTGISTDLNFPRSWCEALAARLKGDKAAAEAAFLKAHTELENTVRQQPDYGPAFMVLGLIEAGLGHKEEALHAGHHAVELLPVTKDAIDGAEIMKYLAVLYAWCGEKDLALEQIQATLRIPSTLSYGNLKLHPNWDALRGDPRFERIVNQLAPKQGEE